MLTKQMKAPTDEGRGVSPDRSNRLVEMIESNMVLVMRRWYIYWNETAVSTRKP